MTDETFTEPEDPSDSWVDVRMTDPETGEWDVDIVVVDGRVDYVDLRIRRECLDRFVECLVDDIGDDRAGRLLAEMAERKDIDLGARSEE
jgi:hypothetical protein